MVVFKKQNYINTAQDLLAQRDTYGLPMGDPINNKNKNKNKLVNMLKAIKAEGGLGYTT